jgi:hypothetical protein
MAGALLLVAIPPFLPMASTAMPDILSTTLALVAIERLAAWKAEQKANRGIAAAVALGLAGFARSHLVLLLPLAVFFLLDSIKPREMLAQIRRKPWLWSPVIAGFGLVLTIILITREPNFAIPPAHFYDGEQRLWRNLFSYLFYFAVPLPFALPVQSRAHFSDLRPTCRGNSVEPSLDQPSACAVLLNHRRRSLLLSDR